MGPPVACSSRIGSMRSDTAPSTLGSNARRRSRQGPRSPGSPLSIPERLALLAICANMKSALQAVRATLSIGADFMNRLRWIQAYRSWAILVAGALLVAGSPRSASASPEMLDLSRAVVVVPPAIGETEKNAVKLLVDDVQRRSGIRWKVVEQWPTEPRPVVAVGQAPEVGAVAGPLGKAIAQDRRPRLAESFRIMTSTEGPEIVVAGTDARGRALRRRQAAPRAADMPGSRARTHRLPARHRSEPSAARASAWLSAEDQLLRRLGPCRSGSNTIRDLAVFGCNAVELIPPRTDDDATARTFRCRRWR